MKKVIICCLFILVLWGSSRGQGSLDQELFDEQKKSVLDSIYANPDFLPLIDVNKAKVQLQDMSKSFERINNQYDMYDEQKQRIEEKYGDVQLTIEKILISSDKTQALIEDTLMKITLFKKNISSLEQRSEVLKNDMEDTKSNVKEYTAFLYRVYNDYYEGEDVISDVKLLVKSENITDTLSTDALVEMLLGKLRDFMSSLQRIQTGYVKSIMELNKAKRAYLDAAAVLKKDMDKLEQQKQNLYKLLSYLQSDKEVAEERVASLKESKQQLAKELGKMQMLAEQGGGVAGSEGVVYDLLNLPDRSDEGNYFTWPVMPVPKLGYVFNDSTYLHQYFSAFDGIRLEVDQGVPVRSMAPGVVYKVEWNSDISLSRVVIVHKYGYTTFYTPLSSIYVAEGQLVSRGEVIGRSGGEVGTNGAGIDSEGPYLDIRIQKNGDPVDPLERLDLSVFGDEKELSDQYQMKYVKDVYGREVSVNFLLKVSGNNVDERRVNFLKRYAGGSAYEDPSIWIDGAKGTGIDPSLGVCIGFAETSYRNFASKNNVGNVYNNDRGDRVDFERPVDGVRAIFTVLNNKYLGEYNTLSELSRFGNTDGFIYASSSFNWQKNIMSCLSAIYGQPVPEDFPYRVD